MKILPFLLSFLLLFQPALYAAGKSTTLKKNQKAPFPGTLLDAEAVAKILADKNLAKLKCDLKLSTESAKMKALHDLKYNSCKINLDVERAKLKQLITLKNNQIERLQKIVLKPKRDLTILWFTIGVAIGVGSTIGIAFAIKEVSK